MTGEQGTALHSFIKKGKTAPVSDSQSAGQFLLLMDALKGAGFEHYEISNFSKPGQNSRHNSNYWKGIPYLGIGPSAHSFNGESRQWNVSNNARYLEALLNNRIPAEIEQLSTSDRINEYLMTSLRTKWGVNLSKIGEDFGSEYRSEVERSMVEFLEKKQLQVDGDVVTLTQEGKIFADHIAAQLFIEAEYS